MYNNGYALEDQAVAMHSSFDSSIRQANKYYYQTVDCNYKRRRSTSLETFLGAMNVVNVSLAFSYGDMTKFGADQD